jgi:hypothetical protein
VVLARPIAELEATAEEIQRGRNRQKAETAARQRVQKLADMAADPTPILRKTEQLVKQRSIDAYRQVATLLADLREALAGSAHADLAEQQAAKLKKDNPTLARLVSELRRTGLLKK